MTDKIERTRLTILRLLKQAGKPLSSEALTEELASQGQDISERTVRFHLLAMDKDGLTEYIGRQGRRITPKGEAETSKARVYEKVGFLSAKINQMTYLMDFSLEKQAGNLIVNISLLEREELFRALPLMLRVFQAGYAMGRRLALFDAGEMIGEQRIPAGYVGIGTICSVTLNGVLLSHGIPVISHFGGLLEMEDGKPSRFVEIIRYDGTSVDPLEVFIKSGMTDYLGATTNGNGRIGVGFREIPATAREKVIALAGQLEAIGLGGFLEIGQPGQALFEIPVNEGMIGCVVIGGLNPIAILEESGMRLQSRALSGLVDFQRLFPFEELLDRAKAFI